MSILKPKITGKYSEKHKNQVPSEKAKNSKTEI